MFNADSHPQENATLLPEIDDGAQRKDDSPEEGVGLFVAFVFTVNMVIGAGIVGLPYAFFHAGAFFSLACLVSATVMAVTTMGYILEVSGWCEGWIAANEAESARSDSPEAPRDIHPFAFVISSKRKFELNELCGVFLGIPVPASCPWLRRFADERGELHPVRRAFELAALCYTFGSCWLYATVFASTMALLVPLPLPGRPPHALCLAADCRRRKPADCAPPCVVGAGGRCAVDSAAALYCDSAYAAFLAVFAVAMLAAACAGLQGLKRSQVPSSPRVPDHAPTHYTRAGARACACMHARTHARTHACMHARTHTTRVQVCSRVLALMHRCTWSCTCTAAHTHTHAHT